MSRGSPGQQLEDVAPRLANQNRVFQLPPKLMSSHERSEFRCDATRIRNHRLLQSLFELEMTSRRVSHNQTSLSRTKPAILQNPPKNEIMFRDGMQYKILVCFYIPMWCSVIIVASPARINVHFCKLRCERWTVSRRSNEICVGHLLHDVHCRAVCACVNCKQIRFRVKG